ncbi:MAG: flagellar hook-length control protein FliK [Bacteriovoracaceae bacterium]|nr:flagellar hook-length control protein FliK [Bacteriovoracaceae bacterium]
MKVLPQKNIQHASQANAAKKISSPFVNVSTGTGEPINFAELLSGEVNLAQAEDAASEIPGTAVAKPVVSEELINQNVNLELLAKNEHPIKKELSEQNKIRSLNDILTDAKQSVEHDYRKAKNSSAELDRLFVKQPAVQIPQDHNVIALNNEASEPVQKFDIESLIQKATPAPEKETFYKNSQPIEYRSMFSTAKVKEARDFYQPESQALELNEMANAQADIQKLLSNASANKVSATAQSLKSYQDFNEKPMLELRPERDLKITKESEAISSMNPALTPEMSDNSFVFAPVVSELKHGTSAATPVKVLDLSSMDVSNSTESINKISDYIQQNHMAARPTIDLKFNHQELGNVGIHVERNDNNTLNISIQTSNNEARNFFSQNQQELFQTLNSNGLKVADIKLESHSSFSKHSEDGATSEHGRQSSSQQFSSQDGQRKHESHRRQELWASYKRQQEVA